MSIDRNGAAYDYDYVYDYEVRNSRKNVRWRSPDARPQAGFGPALRAAKRPTAESPLDRDGKLVAKAVFIEKLLIESAVLVNQPCNLHVIAAVLRNIEQLALPEPANSLQTLRRFLH